MEKVNMYHLLFKTYSNYSWLKIQIYWVLLHTDSACNTAVTPVSNYSLEVMYFGSFSRTVHLCPLQEPEKGSLYINICSWKRVPAPQDPSKPLPLYAGNLETDTDEGQSEKQSRAKSQTPEITFVLYKINYINWCFAGRYTVLDVAFNPAVLQESKKDKTEMNQIYMLALSFAQQLHGFTLSHQYSVVSCSPKSSPYELHCRLRFQQWSSTAKPPDTGRVLSLIIPDTMLQTFYFE